MELSNKQKGLATSIASLIITIMLLQTCAVAKAEGNTSFTSTDKFPIPSSNGEIGFSTNGTYANATLVAGTWNFADLRINDSTPIEMLTASAENSRATITSFRGPNAALNFTFRFAWLRYYAEGQGKQTFNIGIPAGDGRWGLHPEWSVIVNNEWLGEGDGWSITPDGNVTVTGEVGEVSILHFGVLGSSGNNSELSFYEQHSVAIITVASAAATAIVATSIMAKNRGPKPSNGATALTDKENIGEQER